MNERETAKQLLELIHNSTTAIQTAQYAKEQLINAGFTYIDPDRYWDLELNGAYVTVLFDSTVVAFTIGEQFPETGKMRMATAHTDFPGFCIKPNGELKENGYVKLNVELYGGVLLSSWLDRPLSLAGKVILKGADPFSSKVVYYDAKRPLMTIPNLAIHMQRDINEHASYDKQIDMQPLCDAVKETLCEDGYLTDFIADELGVDVDEIINFELYLYNCEEGCVMGLNDSLISSPRLDNLTSVQACIRGITEGTGSDELQMIVMYDNEEIGSRTKQGAGSVLIQMLIEKIYTAFGMGRIDLMHGLMKGKMISLDVAHAYHPNKTAKYDVTNRCYLNKGISFKTASSRSYVCDTEFMAGLLQICKENKIPYQMFANRSSEKGGGTLGAIASATLPMRAQDIGVPILAMHSARETMGVKDQVALEALMVQYFS